MSVIGNFDIDANFWELNPIFKVLGKFANFYKNDKSGNRRISSKIMWAVSLFADTDKENRLRNFSEKDRKKLIAEDYLKDEKFDWEKYEQYVDYYRETQLTAAKRSLMKLKTKLEEREEWITSTPYTMENARELDTILANTDKLFSLSARLEAQIEKEENEASGDVRGGRTESLTEQKII